MAPTFPPSTEGTLEVCAPDETVGSSGLIQRSEYLRLLAQALEEEGFGDLAAALQQRTVRVVPSRSARALDDRTRAPDAGTARREAVSRL